MGACCCHTSFVDVCTLLALSVDLDKDAQDIPVGQEVQDHGDGIDQGEAAWGLDSHFFQDSPSVKVVLDILDQGTFGV